MPNPTGIVRKSDITNIANAIKEKTNSNSTMSISEMPTKIDSIVEPEILTMLQSEYDGLEEKRDCIYAIKDTVVYGWHVNPNDSNPYTAVTYIEDAIGRIPAELNKSIYRRVEYIKSTGTQYIQTDIIPTYTTRTELDVKFSTDHRAGDSNNSHCFGISNTYNGVYEITLVERVSGASSSGNANIFFYSGFAWDSQLTGNNIDNCDLSIRKKLILNRPRSFWGTKEADTNKPINVTDPPDIPVAIFAVNTSSNVYVYSRRDMYLYGLEMYDYQHNLIHKLIPVERQTDGELGLLDTVANVFYNNAGTGTFEKGNYFGDFHYNDWKSAWFMPKPCMLKYDGTVDYYLDENNYVLKKDILHETLHPTIVQGSIGYWPYTIGQSGTRTNVPTRCSTQSYVTIPPFSKVVISTDKEDVVIGGIWSDTNMTYQGPLYTGFNKNRIELENNTATNKYIVLNSIGRMLSGDTDSNPSGNIDPSYFDCIFEIDYQEPSDISNVNYEGNAMMEWPKIWYKFEAGQADGEGYFYCSNKQIDSSYKCWCNYDCNDNIIPHFYTAIYNSTGTSRLRSLSGVQLTQANGSGYTTAEQEITRALSNNTTEGVEWYTDIFSDRILINALLVLLGKSLSIPAVFGKGIGAGSTLTPDNYVTGALNDKGLFFGVQNGNNAVKVFGMENWYGLKWHRTAGIMTDTNNKTYYKLTYGTADGSTVIGYSEQGTGYLTASSSSATGWVTKIDYSNGLPIPKSVTGNITQDYSGSYYGCYYYNKSSASAGSGLMTRALFGGAYDPNSSRKSIAHTATLNMDSSNNGAFNVTTGLSCKPIAATP